MTSVVVIFTVEVTVVVVVLVVVESISSAVAGATSSTEAAIGTNKRILQMNWEFLRG